MVQRHREEAVRQRCRVASFFMPIGKPQPLFCRICKGQKIKDMKYLSLDYIKQHTRIDFDCEDDLLEMYGDSAEEAMSQILNRGKNTEEMVADLTEVYGHVPAPIYPATLMLVASLYKDREKDLVQQVYDNKTFAILVKPYMKL